MAKPKIGSKHPTKPGLVYGYNGRYVAKSTFIRQKNNQIRATKTKTKAPGRGGAIVKSQSSAITKPPSSKPASTRVERVKVKVDPQRQLSGSGQKPALRPGSYKPALKPGSGTTPRGRSSAARAQAAAKAARAAKGSTGTGVRAAGGSGLPKQTPRLPSAGQTARNLLRNKAVTRGPASRLAGIGLIASGIAEAQSLAQSLKRGEGFARLPGMAARALTAKAPARASGPRNRRGNPVNRNKPAVKPARRGMGDIRGTSKDYKADEARLAAAARPKTQPKTQPTVKATQQPPTSKPGNNTKPKKNPYRKPEGDERKDRMSKVVADLKKRREALVKGRKAKASAPKRAASNPRLMSPREKFFARKKKKK